MMSSHSLERCIIAMEALNIYSATKVAVGNAVKRVFARSVKFQQGGGHVAVDGVGSACQRAAACEGA